MLKRKKSVLQKNGRLKYFIAPDDAAGLCQCTIEPNATGKYNAKYDQQIQTKP
jgi:hypothetical protein